MIYRKENTFNQINILYKIYFTASPANLKTSSVESVNKPDRKAVEVEKESRIKNGVWRLLPTNQQTMRSKIERSVMDYGYHPVPTRSGEIRNRKQNKRAGDGQEMGNSSEWNDWNDIGLTPSIFPRSLFSLSVSIMSSNSVSVEQSSSSESVKTVSESSPSLQNSLSRSGSNQALYQLPRKILISGLRPKYSTFRAIPSHWIKPWCRHS